MLGPLPRHSCHPISHSGRGASARETSGRPYLSHHLAAISMAAVYTDAVHIADGVIGLKQRSRGPAE